ncbi:MAG: hypothetical protein ABFS86_07030 [Planctomycetota bacterium]
MQLTDVTAVDLGTNYGNFRGQAWPQPVPEGSKTSAPDIIKYDSKKKIEAELKRRSEERKKSQSSTVK